MTYQLTMPIDSLLAASDEDIQVITDTPATEARKALEEKKAAGEVYIPSAGCKGFDPVTGCPGHPSGKEGGSNEA